MKNKKFFHIIVLFTVLFFLQISFAFADNTTPPPTGFETICAKNAGIAACVQKIYLFSLGLSGLVGVLMVILAGYRYMTAQGNSSQVEEAKSAFEAAFIGIIIIFVAYVLLYLINPDLIKFKSLSLPPIELQ